MRKSNALFIVFLVALSFKAFAQFTDSVKSQPTHSNVVAITDITVIPMDSLRVLKSQTIIIENDTIINMGLTGLIEIPNDAKVVEGEGKFLIPGLTDMHIHIKKGRHNSLVLYLANGITSVQNMHGSEWHLVLREQILNKEVLGPRLFTTGPTTFSSKLKNTPEDAVNFVISQKQAGFDAIKMYGTSPNYSMNIETYQQFMETAKKLNIRVVGHTPRGISMQSILKEGQASVDHAEEIYYSYPPLIKKMGLIADFQFGKISLEEYRYINPEFPDIQKDIRPVIQKLAKDVAQSGLFLSPGLITYRTIVDQISENYIKMQKNPNLKYMHPLNWLYTGPELNSYRSRWSDRLDEMNTLQPFLLEIQKMIVSEFYRAGGPIMGGTDATLTFVTEGFSLHDELQMLVDVGMTSYDALRSATTIPARFLQIEENSGTIAVGKIADLVLLNANPLDDIANAKEIDGVIVRGTYISKKEIDILFYELEKTYKPLWNLISKSQQFFSKGDFQAALANYAEQKSSNDEIANYFESTINSLGYKFLQQNNLNQAEELFILNTEYFPNSANAWDSLAELKMESGDKDAAIKYYQKSLDLNPENNNAKTQIEILKKD